MMATVLLVALVQPPASPADTAAGRPCKMIIDSVGRQAQQVEVRRGESKLVAGGRGAGPCVGPRPAPPPPHAALVSRGPAGSRVGTRIFLPCVLDPLTGTGKENPP